MIPTQIAILTPPGRSALATLAVQGPRAWSITRQFFHKANGQPLPEQPIPGRFWLGKLGNAAGKDEVILAVHSVLPVRLEIHGHGGPEVQRMIVELFRDQGAVVVSWAELEKQRGRDLGYGPGRAAALRALSQAPTVRTAAILLDQFQGAWDRAVAQIHNHLDHGHMAWAQRRLERLLALAPVGHHLIQPWKIVIAGAPNVGKSSLVNALAGFQRALVAPLPGTTRDAVTTTLALDGWPMAITDTAGLRVGGEDLEQAGMDRARAYLAEADLALWMVDGSQPPTWPEQRFEKMLVVINKIDLPAAWDWTAHPDAARVSATLGTGLPEFIGAIVARLLAMVPESGEAVPFTPEMERWATDSLAAVRSRFAPVAKPVL